METKININIISAYCKNNGIGFNNDMPWKFKSDLNKFKSLTTGNKNNAIIMGKNTWNSLNNKSLKYRDNLILSKSIVIDYLDNNNITKSFNTYETLYRFLILKEYDEIWIIGGESIYKQFFELHCKKYLFNINKIYITYINKLYNCDTFFPKIDPTIFKFISNEIHRDYNNLNKLISINNDNNDNNDNKDNNDINNENLHSKYLLFDVLYESI
jgi:dihydrofolate reductase